MKLVALKITALAVIISSAIVIIFLLNKDETQRQFVSLPGDLDGCYINIVDGEASARMSNDHFEIGDMSFAMSRVMEVNGRYFLYTKPRFSIVDSRILRDNNSEDSNYVVFIHKLNKDNVELDFISSNGTDASFRRGKC